MKIIFVDKKGKENRIGKVKTKMESYKLVNNYLKDNKIKTEPYRRYQKIKYKYPRGHTLHEALKVDFGSYSEFIYIVFDSNEEAKDFCDGMFI